MNFAKRYIKETKQILDGINTQHITDVANACAHIRDKNGRLFVVGVGGSAATASHAVNDFRKIASIEAYSPTDNVAELTARINDDGWSTSLVEWLRISKIGKHDGLLVLSVGGGSRHVSENIVAAVCHARFYGASVMGIVGRDGGYTNTWAHHCVVIPPLVADRITSHTEGICSVLLHLIVSHPALCCQ